MIRISRPSGTGWTTSSAWWKTWSARDSESSARNLKYAVLHLAAGVEVFLKARLQYEHWSLVFAQPGTATREALAEARFSPQSPLPKHKSS